jgi:hypothetical protein
MDRISPNTSISINLGTGQQCVDKPPNLAHVSDEHLEGLRVAVIEEHEFRQAERRKLLFKSHNQREMFDSFNDFSDETEDRDFRKRNIFST